MLYLQAYDVYWDPAAVQHGLKTGSLIQVYRYTCTFFVCFRCFEQLQLFFMMLLFCIYILFRNY